MRTIQRRLDKVNVVKPVITNNQNSSVGLIMDTTYFGRGFGVMVFMDNVSGRVLHYAFVKYETNDLYRMGVYAIKDKFALHSITCDGRRGLLGGFGDIPTQMCHFYQIAIVWRYLTKTPNTTNKLEGLFGHLKQSLRCHQAITKKRKQKFIESFLQDYA